VIFAGEKFCEYEYFEWVFVKKMLEEEGIRTLFLEFSLEDEGSVDPYRNRIESFSEMLSG
jgi:benzoyl-CoA reductase/2-hydroxyglutaryl-CoA dehydratase subunit BcrC/BadD/HgdB